MSKVRTQAEWNKDVAAVLGLTPVDGYPLRYVEYRNGETEFCPATDTAAALWALERWCKVRDRGKVETLHSAGNLTLFTDSTWCCFLAFDKVGHGTFCEAIREAIVGAAE